MFSRIVVGVDGGQGGVDALALARRLASTGTEIVAVSVGVVDGHASRGANLDYDRAVHEAAEARLADARARDHDLRGETLIAPSVAEGLHTATGDVDADLIVIGSCRRGPVGRILIGDDARATLRDAPVPVAVAPHDYGLSDRPIVTIGLGWNGGAEGERALEIARALADDLDGQVHAVRVIGAETGPILGGSPIGRAVDTADVAASDPPDGLELTTVTGVPVEELEQFAAEVDLMVVGSHQRGALGRIALGSASEHLARRSERPLVVVPRSRHAAARAS